MISRLNPRERVFVILGGLILVGLLVYFGLLEPYRRSLVHLDQRVASRQEQLQQVKILQQEYQLLQRQLSRVETKLTRRGQTSPVTFIETLATRIGARQNLINMRPQPAVTQEDYQVEAIEIKFERLTLAQALKLLWEIESADFLLLVRDLRLKQRFDDKSLLDASMTVAAFRRAG